MIYKNESTATKRRVAFIFFDANGAPISGLTFATASSEVFVSANGGSWVAAAADVVEIGNGAYYYPASQAEVNTDVFGLRIHKATYTDVFVFPDIIDPAEATAANLTQVQGGTVPTPNVMGVPLVDVQDWQGTAVSGYSSTRGTAGTALPAVAAGANGGVPLVGTQIPNATAGANNGLPVQGGAIPNANAGANNGLPVVGTQIPNANAGAINGLPTQGNAIPNALAGTTSGLPTITATGQGPGGQLKPNSFVDKRVYDGSKRLTSARIRIFSDKSTTDSASDSDADGAHGEVERYRITVTYNVDGTMKTYECGKEL